MLCLGDRGVNWWDSVFPLLGKRLTEIPSIKDDQIVLEECTQIFLHYVSFCRGRRDEHTRIRIGKCHFFSSGLMFHVTALHSALKIQQGPSRMVL